MSAWSRVGAVPPARLAWFALLFVLTLITPATAQQRGTVSGKVLDPAGLGILLKGSWQDIVVSSVTAMVGIGALAGGTQGWFLGRTNTLERTLLIAAGLALVYPHPLADVVGIGLIVAVALMQKLRR